MLGGWGRRGRSVCWQFIPVRAPFWDLVFLLEALSSGRPCDTTINYSPFPFVVVTALWPGGERAPM